MDVGPDPRRRPGREHERCGRQRPQRRRLDRGEHDGRGGPVQRPARPRAGDLPRPHQRRGAHLGQRGELSTPPERVTNVGHRPLDLRLVAGLERTGGVDQRPVVGGQLRIRAVDLRVVEVGLVHAGLEVVRDQPRRDAAEVGERLHVRGGPLRLVHHQRRAHEQVPRARQDHHERPHRPTPPRRRVGPHPEPAVVDLRLLTGRRALAQHRDLRPAGLLGQVRPHPPAQTGHTHGQVVLVTQPLMDRRDRHRGAQLGGDVVTVALDVRPRHLPQPVVDQRREPFRREPSPVVLGHRRPARHHPGRDRWGGVLAQRLAIHAQTCCELVLGSARIPVGQDLDHVDHVEGPPRQRRAPSPRCRASRRSFWTSTGQTRDRHARGPHGELRDRRVGNYVIADPSNLGNFMIADTGGRVAGGCAGSFTRRCHPCAPGHAPGPDRGWLMARPSVPTPRRSWAVSRAVLVAPGTA